MGTIAQNTKKDLEEKIGKSILNEANRLTKKQQSLRDSAHKQMKITDEKKK